MLFTHTKSIAHYAESLTRSGRAVWNLAAMLNLLNSVKLLHFLIAPSSEEHLNTVKASLMGAEVKKTRRPPFGGHKE